MQIEFLGTGGAITTPKPGCTCRICVQAREKGLPYSRTGPSLFVHGPNVLFDTPEEIKAQLNRSCVKEINACFYSHWHPDHVMGRRVWEMNMDVYHWPPSHKRTDVYVPQQAAQDFRNRLGTWEHLLYLQKLRLIRLIELSDGDTIILNGVTICPFRLKEDHVYAFLLEGDGKRILIVLDEMVGWEPPPEMQGVDLAIVPMGLAEFDYFSGERRLPENHPVLKVEATFRQTLEIIRKIKASRVVISHIEEMNGLSYDDFQVLEKQLQNEGFNISFAYDTMVIEV